ncbi:uncharacterized protein IL334_005966 [Kwoniella shivajii]|uniref:MARVEL domain-containing protein n=1 Tax=Kwoniella shivajii TaxID=564305 RepID=A0ABZ1D658_9TREE|nr:hypothetical protein IL334_005966 [Kwoniella shivajii]
MSSSLTRPGIRYALFGLTTVLFILALLLNTLMPGFFTISFINVWIQTFIGVIMLVYYPPSIYFSIKDKATTFDQAGGEVAVGVLITTAWLVCFIMETILASWNFCNDTDSGWYSGAKNCQATAIGLSVLYIINFFIHFGWTTWIIVLVHKSSENRVARKETYKIPTHKLIRGIFTGTKIPEEEAGLYNHRL